MQLMCSVKQTHGPVRSNLCCLQQNIVFGCMFLHITQETSPASASDL